MYACSINAKFSLHLHFFLFFQVEYLKAKLRLIHHYLVNSTQSELPDVEDVYSAFEDISDTCENCDLAKDLHKIGGYDVVIRSLKHEDCEIRLVILDFESMILFFILHFSIDGVLVMSWLWCPRTTSIVRMPW